ncbi:GNAT family N-acetyltransferase [Cyanobium sp. CH-040]|uniref:GNAT family N-acetyltransferase n=1 Tax=Cyanobium sp. CH-040 TaxID=2823708 RepID=UPI0020CF0814|nr:N-acetyltransferase [Cyanobium sp. CH-040]
MRLATCGRDDAAEFQRLFITTFTASEGEAEGRLIGALVGDLINGTDSQDRHCFMATQDDRIVGGIVVSRLRFESGTDAFLMAPVAVLPDVQRRGIGQRLIRFGLEALARQGVELVLTYGDPRFYSQVGFQPTTTAVIPSPLPLQRPEGWLAQSLTGQALQPIQGPSCCVAALRKPELW